ncbi:MAG: VOC family protein, partial [Nocardioides sp.]|nr:VOC family protein [Nocardioides sp.]
MTLSDTPGAPCWIELFTTDPEAAAAFYGDLFGWSFTDPNPDLGGYQSVLLDGEIVAGMMRNDGTTDEPSAWTTYLETADIDDTARRIAAHGGKVLVGPHQVGGLGHMLFATDPGGAMVGAWQP